MKYFLIMVMVVISAGCVKQYVNSHVAHHSGEKTQVVDAAQFNPLAGQLAITGVNVLSVDAQTMQSNQTVLINHGVIESVQAAGPVPAGYQSIDGTGKFMIPGLTDTHTHPKKSPNELLLYLANGVTQLVTNNSWDGLYLEWREAAQKGALSPQIHVAAGGLSTKRGLWRKVRIMFGENRGYNTPGQARAAVRSFYEQGYDAIKIYQLDKDIYYAAAAEAKSLGLPVWGHLPPSADLNDLYQSGQSQVAHVEEITKATIREYGGYGQLVDEPDAYLNHLKERADGIAQQLKTHGISVSSTVWIIESIPHQDFMLDEFLKTVELDYVNPGVIEGSKFAMGWLPGNNGYENTENTDPDSIERSRGYWETYIEAIHIMTRAMVKQGVNLTVGTDSVGTGVVAGFSIHDEMNSLHKIGLSTAQVLYAATVASAQWLQTSTGQIAAGFQADLVLLNQNPLTDIRHTRDIHAVVAKGKFMSRTELDHLLSAVKQANQNSREVSIEAYVD